MKFGDKIKEFRKNKGLTQKDLGDLVGKTQGQISELEIDHTTPSHEDLIKLSKALDVSITKLYGIENDDDLLIEVAKGKGLTIEEVIKAIEIYNVIKDK